MKMAFEHTSLKDGWEVTFNPKECPPGLLRRVERVLTLGCMPAGWVRVESSHTARVWKFSLGRRPLIFKEFLDRGPLESVKKFIKGTRAERAWRGGMLLAERGFLTPPMVVWGVKTTKGRQTRNFLVTGFVPDSCGLGTFLREKFALFPEKERLPLKRRIASSLGRTIGRLHSEGIIHGDLRLDNIMVKNIGGEMPEFYFIDNERNTLFRTVSLKSIVKNLVQVNMVDLPCVGRKDRLGFLCAYLKEFPGMQPWKNELIKRVWGTTEERMRKKHGGLMVW